MACARAARPGPGSVFGFNREWELPGPGPQSGGSGLAQLPADRVLPDGTLLVRAGELPVELQVLEPVSGNVMASGGVDHARDPGPVTSDQAHRARLAAGVHDTVIEQVPSQGGAGFAQRHDFRVRGGVAEFDHLAGAFPDDLAVDDDQRAEGRFAVVIQRAAGDVDGALEVAAIVVVKG